MRISYPRSFLRLLLLGYGLTMLPLLLAFGNASLYVDRLAEQSQNTLSQAVQATRSSRVLLEQLNVMERSARQYFVLEDKLLLDNYQIAHDKFIETIRELSMIPLSQDQQRALRLLADSESRLFNDILIQTHSLTPPETIVAEFSELAAQAQDILSENNRLIDRESQALAEAARQTQQQMLQQTVTLVPVALLVALIITFLVAQPIRRMDAAIRKLGEGKYSDPISIDGPGDLRSLGERLDWLRSQLEELEIQKQRFLRHISHELKTPLTSIREGSELLLDEVGGNLTPQQQEIAEIIRESSQRLQKMIENLLSFTSVQFQKPALKRELLSVNKLMEKVLEDHALTIHNKNIRIIKDFHQERLRADKEKLQTILDNLISNAIKYTPHSGSILLRLQHEDRHVIIEVHDGGPGVMARDRARLFDPFYRGSGVHDSLVQGSGLGLSIAKEFVDAHGGEITLLPSKSGAHFRVTLPMDAIKLP